MDRLKDGEGVGQRVFGDEERDGLTVGQGDDLARPFCLCHSPDVLYRVGLALPGLSTEVVREIAILPDAWAVGGDPLKSGALVLKVGGDDGGEGKLDSLEVGLDEGEAGEGGGEESHGEGSTGSRRGIYISYSACWVSPHPPEFLDAMCITETQEIPRPGCHYRSRAGYG